MNNQQLSKKNNVLAIYRRAALVKTSVVTLLIAGLLGLNNSVHAATYYWDTTTTGTWSTGSNWSNTISNGTTGTAPTSSDIVVFDQSSVNGAEIVQLSADTSITGISFSNTGTTALKSDSSTTRALTLGSSGITINAGAGAVTLGDATNVMNIALGASQTWANNSSNTFTVTNSVTGTATTGNTQTLTIGGMGSGATTFSGIIGDGSSGGKLALTKTGTGTLTLSGSSTYTGATTLSGGTLTLSGSISSSSALVLGGATLSYTKTGTNTQTFNGTTLNAGLSTVTNATSTNTIDLGTTTRNTGATLNISSLTGTTKTSLSVDSTGILGTWLTTGSGTSLKYAAGGGGNAITAYSGGTAVTATTSVTDTTGAVNYDLNTTTAGSLGSSASFNTLRYTGAGVSISGNFTANGLMNAGSGALTYSGGVTIGASKELVITGNTQSTTFSGIIANNGGGASSVTIGTAGTVALNAANTYSGGTYLGGGLVTFNNNTSFGTGTVTTSGGVSIRNTATVTTTNNFVINGPTTLDVSGGNWNFNGNLSGSGDITRGSNATLTLYLGGDDSGYTGTFTVPNAGNAVLRFNAATAGSANAKWVFNNTTAGRTTLSFGGTTGIISFGSMTGSGNVSSDTAGTKTISAGALGLNDTFSGTITNATGTVALTKVGAGTMTLSGSNTYGGITTISGGTLSVSTLANGGTTSNIGNSSNVAANLILNGGTLQYTGAAVSTDRLFSLQSSSSIDASGTGAVNFTNTGSMGFNSGTAAKTLTLTGSNTGANTLAAIIGDNTGATSLVKSGPGSWTLSGANTYTGGTTISAGILKVGNASALGSSGSLVDNGTLDLNNNSITVGDFSGSGTVTASSGTVTLTEGGSSNTTFSGVIQDGGGTVALTKAGTGTTTLTGTNTYTGGTTISAGTLKLGDGSTTNGTVAGNILNNATLTFANPNTQSYTGVISGTGAVTKSGAGTLTLSGNNSYGGNTTVNAGTLVLSGTQSITGGISAADAANLQVKLGSAGAATLTPSSLTLGGSGANSSTLTIDFNNLTNPTTAPISITGSGNLLINGTVNLAGLNGSNLSNGTFNLITTNTGSITGTFANSTITLGARSSGSIGYLSNAVTMTVTTDSITWSGATDTTWGGSGNWATVTIPASTSFLTNDIVKLGDTYNVGSGNVSLTSPQTVSISGSDVTPASVAFNNSSVDYTISGSNGITGSGTLTKSGSGTATINNANTYSGGTTVSAGTLVIGNASALGTGAVTVNSGTLKVGVASATMGSGAVAVNGGTLDLNGNNTTVGALSGTGSGAAVTNNSSSSNATLTAGDSTNTTYAGQLIDGSNGKTLALVKQGSGTLTLSGTNTYTGGTTISAGTLKLGDGTTDSTVAGNITDNATLAFNNVGSLSYGGVISGTGALTKSSAGTLTLSGVNTYTGGTTVSAGTLTVSGSGTLGATTNALAMSGGKFDLGGTSQTVGAVTISTVPGSGNVIDNGTLTANSVTASNNSGTATIGATLAGTGSVTMSGSGTLALTGSNTYSGGTTISSGTVRLGNANAVQNSTVTINSTNGLAFSTGIGTFNLGGLSGASNQALTDTGNNAVTLSVGANNANTTYSGVLSGSGALIKTGTGALSLSGANTYSGGTTLNAGTVNVLNAAAFGATSGAVTLNGGTINNTGAAGNLTISNPIVVGSGGGTIQLSTAINLTFSGNITGSGALSLGGLSTNTSLYLNGDNSGYTGTATVSSVGTNKIRFLNATAGSANAAWVFNNTVTMSFNTAGTINFGSLSGTGSLSADVGAVTHTIQAGNLGLNDTYSGVIANGVAGSTTVLTKVGSGTMTLSGANTFTGGVNLNGGKINLGIAENAGTNGPLGASGTISFNGGALQYTSTNTFDYSSRFSNAASQAYKVDTNGQNVTWATALSSSGGSLTKSGTGTLTLTAANTYDGGTTINGGTLALSGSGTLGSTSAALTVSGGALDLGGTSQTAGAVTVSNGGAIQNGTLTSNTSYGVQSGTVSAILAGTGALTKSGSGTAILTNANTYSGGTTISAGTLQLGDGSSNNGSVVGDITDNSVLTFANPSAQTYGGVISGTGSVTVAGVSTLTLTGANTYNGGTTVNSGSVLSGTTTGVQGNIANSGTVNFTNTSTGTYAGNMSGSGSLNMNGSGIVKLSGSNTYTGTTTINSGTLSVNGSLTGSNIQVNVGGTLGGSGVINGGPLSGGSPTTGINVQGTLSPGNSPGLLTVNDTNLNLQGGSSFLWQLNNNVASVSSTPDGIRGVAFDAVNVTGAGALTIGSGVTATLDFLTGVDFTNSFWTTNEQWLVFSDANLDISNAPSTIFNSVSYTFNGSSFDPSAYGTFSWVTGDTLGGNANDIYLQFTAAVPEPSTYAMMGLGLAALLVWQRKRRQSQEMV